ncbi:MAG: hypothetical protein WC523_07280, partial [Patescibacteria group bacterium]
YDNADELLRLNRATASYPTKFKVGTDSAFVINSGNSDVLAIKSGKVGIGLTSPTSTLTVAGTVESTTGGFKFPDGTTQTTAASGSSAWTTSGDNIYNSNSGNVGIGVSNPTSKLEVGGNANIKIGLYAAIGRQYSSATTVIGNNVGVDETTVNQMVNLMDHASYAGSAIQINGLTGIVFHTKSGAATAGAAYNSPQMVIDNTGNVGIGTTAPLAIISSAPLFASATPKLEIKTGTSLGAYEELLTLRHSSMDTNAVTRRLGILMKMSSEGSDGESNKMGGIILDTSSGWANGPALHLLTANQKRLTIDSSGNVGIGTTSPGEKLEVSGNIKLSGASPTYTITNVVAPTNSSDVATKGYVDSLNQSAVAFRYAYNAACPAVTGVTLRVAWFYDDLYEQWTTGTDCGSRKHCVCYYSSL